MNVSVDPTNTSSNILVPSDPSSDEYTISKPQTPTINKAGYAYVKTTNGETLTRLVKEYSDIIIKNATGEEIRVISFSQHAGIFGAHKLKRNVVFTNAPVSNVIDPNFNTIQHVPAVIKQRKSSSSLKVGSDLNPFVAKQLFELAVLRKEMCPITAEEFSVGNTAVMPCGHLFMQMAIEESFKKERNKCPWCRQHGSPTYV